MTDTMQTDAMPAGTMLAGTFGGVGVLDVTQHRVPTIDHDDWVIIATEGCGVCGSDLHILSDPPGFEATPGAVLGHEFLGVIVEAGPGVRQAKVGDRVAVAPNLTCGICRYCKMGKSNHCENWTTLGLHIDGGFAPYVAAPERALHQVSHELAFDDAVWIEPLSCVVNGTDQIAIQPGQTAVVLGAGAIGMLHSMLFQAAGARVIITDIAPFRLEAARRFGVDVAIDGAGDVAGEVMQLTDGLGADVVVDAVGNQLGNAVPLAARGGKVALFGMIEHAAPPVKQFDITRNELTVIGTFVGAHTFPRAVQILESGVIRPGVLNSLTVPVAEMQRGIDAARAGEAIKVVVTPT